MTCRLCDYFLVAAWKPVGSGAGRVVQPTITDRFPIQDWHDYALPAAAAIMCLAEGKPVMPGPPPPPTCFTFVMAAEDGARVYGPCVLFWVKDEQVAAEAQLPPNTDLSTIYTPRCLCLLSHWPFLATFQQALTEIYRLSISESGAPMEAHIRQLLLEVPLPPMGRMCVQFKVGSRSLVLRRPAINQLPLSEVSFSLLFHCLDIDSVIMLINYIIHETRIILRATNLALLTPFGEALRGCLFPLAWQHAYIPVLPRDLVEFTQSPCPYIMGVVTEHLHVASLPSGVVIVDLDTGIMELSAGALHDDPRWPPPDIPKQLRAELVSKLREANVSTEGRLGVPSDFGMVFLRAPSPPSVCDSPGDLPVMPSSPTLEPLSPSGMSRTRSRIKPVDSAGVRKAFLNFFATLLEKYRTYVLDAAMHTAMSPAGVQGSSSAPAALFDTEAFLQAAPEKHREYLHSIVNTISFMRWVEDVAHASKTDWELRFWDAILEERAQGQHFLWGRKAVPFLQAQSGPEQVYRVPPLASQPGGPFEYDEFPSLEPLLLQQKPEGTEGQAPQLSELGPLPKRNFAAHETTGEFDFVQQELVMAKFSLAQTTRQRDIMWQDMQSLAAQIEKLDMQKAIFEEQVVQLYESSLANGEIPPADELLRPDPRNVCAEASALPMVQAPNVVPEGAVIMSKALLLGDEDAIPAEVPSREPTSPSGNEGTSPLWLGVEAPISVDLDEPQSQEEAGLARGMGDATDVASLGRGPGGRITQPLITQSGRDSPLITPEPSPLPSPATMGSSNAESLRQALRKAMEVDCTEKRKKAGSANCSPCTSPSELGLN